MLVDNTLIIHIIVRQGRINDNNVFQNESAYFKILRNITDFSNTSSGTIITIVPRRTKFGVFAVRVRDAAPNAYFTIWRLSSCAIFL